MIPNIGVESFRKFKPSGRWRQVRLAFPRVWRDPEETPHNGGVQDAFQIYATDLGLILSAFQRGKRKRVSRKIAERSQKQEITRVWPENGLWR